MVPSPTEPKLCEAGVIVIGATPVPVRVMVCGEVVALSVTVMLPVCAPRAEGVKVMLMLQFLPAATEVPQVLDTPNSLLLDTILVTLRAVVVLVLLSLTVRAELVEPTATLPNELDVADKVATCACAVSIAAAIRKKREETRSARVGMSEERNSGFIRSPAKFEMGPGMHATTWLLGRLSPASP